MVWQSVTRFAERVSAMSWRQRTALALRAIAYLVLALVVAGAVTYVVAPDLFRERISGFGSSAAPNPASDKTKEELKSLTERAQSEFSAASSDHWTIAIWFASCQGAATPYDLPNVIAAQLTPFGQDDWSGSEDQVKALPTPQQRQVAQLSLNLYRERIAGAGSVASSETHAAIMQWVIILLGLLTTIVVSLSSTEYGKGEERVAKNLRLTAIMLPAIGTAVAAVNAFYSPSQKAVQAERTLSSLGQLHNQIASESWGIACIADPKDPAWLQNDNKIALWIKRYQEIRTAAGTAADTSGSSGQSAAKGGSSK